MRYLHCQATATIWFTPHAISAENAGLNYLHLDCEQDRSRGFTVLHEGWRPLAGIKEKHIGSSVHRPDLTVLRDSNKNMVL